MELFKLFMPIVNENQMLGQFRESINNVVKDRTVKEGFIYANLPERHSRRVCRNKKRTGREFQIDAQIAGFQIKGTMLDLIRCDIMPRKTWEALESLSWCSLQFNYAW